MVFIVLGLFLLAQDAKGDYRTGNLTRELLRMDMALSQAQRRAEGRPIIAMMHYPPLTDACRDTEWVALLKQYGVRDLVYGHLHGAALRSAFRGLYEGIRFHQASCDGLGFKLYRLPED